MYTTSSSFFLNVCIITTILVLVSCQKSVEQNPEKETEIKTEESKKPSVQAIKEQLQKNGFKTFDYIDKQSGDTIVMQQYFIAFLKRGPNRSQNKQETDSLQKLHLAHLGRMYNEGYADISGPFGDDGDIRGITIYNTPNQKMADSLANMDPMVKAGRLIIEIHPWWAAKGFPLR